VKKGAQHANIERLQADADVAFIALRRVIEISGFCKATITKKIKAGEFPAPVIHDGNCTRWDLGEVLAWREKQFKGRAARQQQAAANAPA